MGTSVSGFRQKAAVAWAAIAVASFAAPAAYGQEAGIRIRFREHFDVSRIHWNAVGVDQTYWGATNTLNLWWEEPGAWAFGLAFQPVLTDGYRQITDDQSPQVAQKVTLYQFGLEGMWSLWSRTRETKAGPYARAGAYAALLEVPPQFGGDRWGGSYYVALGWEIPLFGNSIGLKPDVGFRHSILEQSTQVLTFSPSLAVTLYFLSDWLAGGR